jgi:ketosteroid isomerase-like protein
MLLVLFVDATSAQSVDGVKGLDKAWVAAAKKGDVEAIVALYAPDAVYHLPDSFELRGAAAIRKSYTDWFAAMTIPDATFDTTYTTSGDLSLGFGTVTVTMQPQGGWHSAGDEGPRHRCGEQGRRPVEVSRGPRIRSAPRSRHRPSSRTSFASTR